jgi:hypothetical protein
MADIFVSYAKEDQAHVDLLSEHLEAKRYTIWYDTQLLPGHEWRTRLREVVSRSWLRIRSGVISGLNIPQAKPAVSSRRWRQRQCRRIQQMC